VGKSLTRNVTAPLVLIGAGAIKTAADFEVAMNQVAVATDTPVSGLKNLSDLAKQLGADTIFSANEAAQAMLELAKAGISPAEISSGALANTLNLAAASGMGLAESAVVMSAGMNTFNLGAKDSVSIVDALAGAANASAADVTDIAMALQQVGQQAVASGLTIQETTAALAAFADAGVRGSDAGTSFKTFLQRLNPVSAESAKTMKQLGIDFFDANGNMISLSEIAGELQTGFKGLTQEQRLAAMQTIFGSDALRAANILFTEGASGINDYIAASTAQGSAAKMAEARMSGLAGALESLRGSIETVALLIGERLAPAVTDIAGKIQNFANAFSFLSPKMQDAIIKFALIAAVLGPAIIIIGAVISGLGKMIVVLKLVGAAVGFLATQWTGVGVAATGAGIATVAATTMIKRALITTGVGALILAIGFIATKFYDAAKAADEFSVAKKRALAGQESRDVARAKGRGSSPEKTLEQQLDDLNEMMKDLGGTTTPQADKAIKGLSESAKIAQAQMSKLSDELSRNNDILAKAKDAYNSFKNGIKGVITGIIDFGSAATAETGTFLENLLAQATKAQDFGIKVRTLLGMGLSETAIGQVLAAGADAGTKIADEIIAGGATIVNQINTLVDATASVAEELGSAAATQFYQAGITAGQSLVDGVKAAIAAAGFTINVDGSLVNQGAINQVNAAVAKAKSGKTAKARKISDKERTAIENLAASLGVDVPALAAGGIVTRPTLALIGEAGPEAVVPLSGRGAGMGTTINLTVNAGIGSDGAQIGREIVDAIKRFERKSGPVFVSA